MDRDTIMFDIKELKEMKECEFEDPLVSKKIDV